MLPASLLSAEAQPDEVEGSAHSNQESDEGQIRGIEEAIGSPANPAPEEEPRYEVAEDRPEGVLFAAAIAWFLGHAAMVDEFSTLDN